MRNDKPTVWVADDDAEVRAYLSAFLTSRGYEVTTFESGEQVIPQLRLASSPALLILDIRMPRLGGLEVMAELSAQALQIPIIVLSGMSQPATIVKAMRLGAVDFVVKPINGTRLEEAIRNTLNVSPEAPSLPAATDELESPFFATENKRMLQIRAICDQVAYADVPILMLGESGVGKEVLARYVHERSRRNGPFVKVNCAALPAELLESELFGHERGAFTGAQRDKPGKFELAMGGTLMLDEIGEMSPLLQAKLLHVLQDGEFCRVGGTRTLTSNARIIAATNKRPEKLLASGEFREDLFFRLNVITVEVPPLRDRPEEIAVLCDYFVQKYRVRYKSDVHQLPTELLSAFANYSWPGNVRQLENHVKRFLILPDIRMALLELRRDTLWSEPAPRTGSFTGVSLKEQSANAAESAERELILQTLNEVNWNRKVAARRLHICYKSLLSKLHRWELRGHVAKFDAASAAGNGSGERYQSPVV
jgi:two-component system, NtrC family, response regulator AtoC